MFNLIKKFLKKPDDENIEFIRKSKYFDENYYKLEIKKTKTIGNIEKWKNVKVQYKNLNMPLEELVLKSVEIIKN